MADRKIELDIVARDRASRAIENVADAADDAGRELRDTARAAGTLDERMEQAQASVRRLAREMAGLDQGSARFKELNKEFNAANRNLSQLSKLRKAVGEIKVDVDVDVDRGRLRRLGANISRGLGAAMYAGSEVASGLSEAMAAAGPKVKAAAITVAVGAAAAMAPVLGAALVSGVLLAVGGGALAAGIAAAARSGPVKAAFATFGDEAKAVFAQFGKAFEGPLVRAAGTFRTALKGMAPELSALGRSVAPIVDQLAPALAQMAREALPGIRIAVEASKPFFTELARQLPMIGRAISIFFAEMSKGGPGALQFFADFLTATAYAIAGIGKLIGWLSRMYSSLRSGAVAAAAVAAGAFSRMARMALTALGMIINGMARMFGFIPGIGPRIKAAASSFNAFAAQAIGHLNRVQRAINGLRGKTVHNNVVTFFTSRGSPATMGGPGGPRYGRGFLERAGGGPVGPGQSYLVGEKGPELVQFSGRGNVVPADRTRRMLSPVGASAAAGRTVGAAGGSRPGAGGGGYLELRGDREIVALIRRLVRTSNLAIS